MDAQPRRHPNDLLPLRDSSTRHLRLFHGVSLVRLSAEANVSLRKLSLAERGLYRLSPDEARRRDEALRRLAESAR
jgi:hypothetical protein